MQYFRSSSIIAAALGVASRTRITALASSRGPRRDRRHGAETRREPAGRAGDGHGVRRGNHRAGAHPEHARLREPHVEHDADGDAEQRVRVRQHPRLGPDPQRRSDGRRRRRRRAVDDEPRVLARPLRHPADRGAQRPARRAVRPQRHGRRDQHHDEAADDASPRSTCAAASATATTCNSPASRAARSAADDVRGRVVVGYKDADGWRDNVATDVKADPYEDLTVAGKLLWDIGASTTLDLRLTLQQHGVDGLAIRLERAELRDGLPRQRAVSRQRHRAARARACRRRSRRSIGDPNNTSIKHQGNEPGMDDREVAESVGQVRLGSRRSAR